MSIRRILTVIAVASLVLIAGCAGGTDTDATTTTSPTSDDVEKVDTTTTKEASVGENGNRTAHIVTAHSGTEMLVQYADGTKENVTLAAVRVPKLDYRGGGVETTSDPTDFYFHEPTDEEEASEHKDVILSAGYEAHMYVHQSNIEVTVRPTPGGGTDADGNKLVYMYFDAEGKMMPLSLWYVAEGFGVMVDDPSLHADEIAKAQEWAKNNDKGLWGEDEAGESHEGRPDF